MTPLTDSGMIERHRPARRRSPVGRRLLTSVSMIAFLFGPAGNIGDGTLYLMRSAQAASALFSDLTPLSENSLARHRGGFSVGALDISVGVNIDTAVDGAVQVSTNYSVEQSGKLTKIGTTVATVGADGDMVPDASQIVDDSMPDTDAIVKEATPDTDAIVQEALGKGDKKESGPTVTAAADTGGPAAPQADVAPPPAADSTPAPKSSKPETPGTAANTGPAASSSAKPASPSTSAPKSPSPAPADPPAQATASASPPPPAKTPEPVDVKPAFDDQVTKEPVTQTASAVTETVKTAAKTTRKAQTESRTAKPAEVKTASAAPTPSESTNPRPSPGSSKPAKSSKPAGSKTPEVETAVTVAKRTAAKSTSEPAGPEATAAAPVIEALEQARIVHRTSNGHLSVIENTLNDLSVRQATAINVTVENFTQVRALSKLRESMSTMARDVAISSLRR